MYHGVVFNLQWVLMNYYSIFYQDGCTPKTYLAGEVKTKFSDLQHYCRIRGNYNNNIQFDTNRKMGMGTKLSAR
jgi:hypothetical protein